MDKSRQDGHRYLCKSQIAEIYQLAYSTISKRLAGVEPHHQSGRTQFWAISEIAPLIDVRDENKADDEYNPIGLNPDDMIPADRRNFYASEDLRQAALIKQRKNLMEERQLLHVSDVEADIVAAFKAIVIRLDTLPDVLERDGIVKPDKLSYITELVDAMRDGFYNDMCKLSEELKENKP